MVKFKSYYLRNNPSGEFGKKIFLLIFWLTKLGVSNLNLYSVSHLARMCIEERVFETVQWKRRAQTNAADADRGRAQEFPWNCALVLSLLLQIVIFHGQTNEHRPAYAAYHLLCFHCNRFRLCPRILLFECCVYIIYYFTLSAFECTCAFQHNAKNYAEMKKKIWENESPVLYEMHFRFFLVWPPWSDGIALCARHCIVYIS